MIKKEDLMKIFIIFIFLHLFLSCICDTQFTVTNKCPFTIWVGIQSNEGSKSQPNWKLPHNGGWILPSGQSSDIYVPSDLMGGRIWGRTGCDSNGQNCETGDCGALECNGRQGVNPQTLAEFGLCEWLCLDFYDISLVDGFNLPLSFKPKKIYPGVECPSLECLGDVLGHCTEDLKVYKNGKLVGCQSSCAITHRDEDCCEGAFNNANCPKSASSYIFHNACPNAYSYAKDDINTKACKETGYDIVFCDGGSVPDPSPTPIPTPSNGGFRFNSADIQGNDIGNVKRAYWTDCYDVCYATNNCKSFSWSSFNGGTCWLKSTSDKKFINNNSGVMSGFLCQIQNNMDIGGNDIGSFAATNPSNCCGICAKNDGCKAFAWNNYNGGTCWLKSGGTLVSKSGVSSFASN